jgi:primosomal protein N' (replication factor Y)
VLAQVAGRAGRGDTPGKVIMQTYNPGHFIIEASQKQDFFKFFQNEAPFRKALMYPPFSRMIQLKISGTMEKKVKAYAFRVAQVLKELIDTEKPSRTDLVFHPDSVHNKDKNLSPGLPGDSYKRSKDVQILGPIEAGIQKISSHFRWQILLKSPSAAQVNWLVKSMMDHPDIKQGSKIKLIIDVDPYFFM